MNRLHIGHQMARVALGVIVVGAFAASCSTDPEQVSTSTVSAGAGGTAGSGGNAPAGSGGSSIGGGGGNTASGTGGSDAGVSSDGSGGSGGIVREGGVGDAPGEPDARADSGGSIGTCSSNLEGVCIRFPSQKTKLTLAEAAQGVTFKYEVVIARDVPGVITLPQDSGRCGSPAPGGVFVLEQILGGGKLYCVCDTGLCLPPVATPKTLLAGTYSATFNWDGKSWSGPSDTSNPKGPPFPAGFYNLNVTSIGLREIDGGRTGFNLTGALGIELVQ